MSEQTKTRTHHQFSPSKLEMLEGCPCYDSANTASDAAFVGTLQHEAVEGMVDDPRLGDAHAGAVAQCIQYCEELSAKYPGGQVIREERLPIDDEVYVVEIDGKKQVVESTTSGYLDFAVISADGEIAEIADWKFGRNAVSKASGNLQGIAYMLGLKRKFPSIKTCTVRFIQPHIDDASEHTFSLSDSAPLRLRILTVVSRAVEARRAALDFSFATPNPSSCLFCKNLGKCPAVAAVALKVGHKYSPLEIPESVSTAVFTDPAQVATGLKLAAVIAVWASAYRAQATAHTISDPKFVPAGYKLVSMSKRKVLAARKLGELAKEYLAPEDHEKIEALFEIPIGKLERLISIGAPRGSKEARVAEFGLAALAVGAVEEGEAYAFLRQDAKAKE